MSVLLAASCVATPMDVGAFDAAKDGGRAGVSILTSTRLPHCHDTDAKGEQDSSGCPGFVSCLLTSCARPRELRFVEQASTRERYSLFSRAEAKPSPLVRINVDCRVIRTVCHREVLRTQVAMVLRSRSLRLEDTCGRGSVGNVERPGAAGIVKKPSNAMSSDSVCRLATDRGMRAPDGTEAVVHKSYIFRNRREAGLCLEWVYSCSARINPMSVSSQHVKRELKN